MTESWEKERIQKSGLKIYTELFTNWKRISRRGLMMMVASIGRPQDKVQHSVLYWWITQEGDTMLA